MIYKEEFETRKDVFRVNVFHNKKNGEKVTLYFVPQTTPVNENTVFDYCTKNKTWREKQAQQWCDEKSGKNKDKLKSLPFVAGGLQRDLKWFGDKATAVFDDYKKGLGMTVQPKTNSQNNSNKKSTSLIDKIKEVDWTQQNMVIANFRVLFGIKDEKDLKQKMPTKEIGHYSDGTSKIEAQYNNNGKIYSAVGHNAKDTRREIIYDILEKEYGIDVRQQINKKSHEEEQILLQQEQNKNQEIMKYLKVLSEHKSIDVFPAETHKDVNTFCIPFYSDREGSICLPLEESNISLEKIRATNVTSEERKRYTKEIDKQIDDVIRSYIIAEEKIKKEEKLKEEAQKQIKKDTKVAELKKVIAQKKQEEIASLKLQLLEKTNIDNEHRIYLLQDDKNNKYKLNVDYEDDTSFTKTGSKYNEDTEIYYPIYEEIPMKKLTVGYEKLESDEKFSFSASVEKEVNNKNPLSLDLVFGANLNLTINQTEDKAQTLLLRKLLKESKDPINASPKKFKEQQTFKGR